jgi:hypothetical protein
MWFPFFKPFCSVTKLDSKKKIGLSHYKLDLSLIPDSTINIQAMDWLSVSQGHKFV